MECLSSSFLLPLRCVQFSGRLSHGPVTVFYSLSFCRFLFWGLCANPSPPALTSCQSDGLCTAPKPEPERRPSLHSVLHEDGHPRYDRSRTHGRPPQAEHRHVRFLHGTLAFFSREKRWCEQQTAERMVPETTLAWKGRPLLS